MRAFLAATCTHTLDLSRGKLTVFPGKVDAFLEFQKEKREHDMRSNEAILSKRRHLEDFIARNKSPGSHRYVGQVEKQATAQNWLELNEITTDEATANIQAPGC